MGAGGAPAPGAARAESLHREREKEAGKVRGLIRFWQGTLDGKKWLMDPTTREMIMETLRVLKALDKAARMTEVDRQIEAIRLRKKPQ